MTDAFTTAATAEARRGSPLYDNEVLSYGVRMAVWARDHLAAQEPTDAEVEAAARALADWDGADGWGTPGWTGHVPESSYVHGARAALHAARAVRRDEEKR